VPLILGVTLLIVVFGRAKLFKRPLLL
jgi:hypothetical protein